MSSNLKAGILLGVFCAAWQIIMGITGWYLHPILLNLFWVVIIIQIGILIWGLKQTSEVKTYWQQVGSGTLISLYGGIILFFFSILFTTIFFPNYFSDLKVMHEQILLEQGMNEVEISAQVELASSTQTSFLQALFGFTGTIFTGFLLSLIIGAFYKKKQM